MTTNICTSRTPALQLALLPCAAERRSDDFVDTRDREDSVPSRPSRCSPGSSFADLAEVRARIDEIDQQLIELLAQRAAAVMAAIPFKAGTTLAQAQRRRDDVVRRAVALAHQIKTPFGSEFECIVGDLFLNLTTSSMNVQVRVGQLKY